ncbi:hypothetical protein HFO56_23255 [Rhizobium laguerreae]|uniref:hypothetical protein n=1 Tax=Rhizobium laguerreae TaxID=1076926 RepID=UPI001C927E9D|nr:hypothetical protein [Rhizobium laguerreae]MBY3155244.1 hypothetical protein [Rhizobium laguerreae]MBY3432708.1 hypothetical protein [Rhizobium laguerreae]
MDKFEHWKDRYEAAVAKITAYRSDEHDDMRLVTQWLLNTESNPYDFLMWSDARSFESAESFSGLLHMIHHALVDDGEITFVAVNGRPMIVFANEHEIGNVELRSEVERQIAERRGLETTVEIIAGVPAFIERRERYESDRAARIAFLRAYRSGELGQPERRDIREILDTDDPMPSAEEPASLTPPK